MAEKAQQARIDADIIPIKAESRALVMATFGVTFLPWLLILSAVGLAIAGQQTAAWITGAVGLLGGGATVIQATRRPRVLDPSPSQPTAREKSGPTPRQKRRR